jgi:tRNA nucleotidyltransferase (CCA-adding enzyme)
VNLASKVKSYFPKELLELLRDTSNEASKLGQRVYLVGGIVRDLLLGYPNFDLDLVTEGDAVELANRIARISGAGLVIYPRFSTAKIKSGDFAIDIATARSETYARPGALPAVTPSSIEKDLFRRDFSINAMAISLTAEDYGQLLDPHRGKDDLHSHLIRILHPDSFSDDATRILRAIRYEQRLGFNLEHETARLLKRDIPMLDTISGDRIRHELELIFREELPERAIKRLGDLGALQRINHSLGGNEWLAAKFDDARRLGKPGELPALYFCLLAYPLNGEQLNQLVSRLNPSAKLTKTLKDTARLKLHLTQLNKPSLKPSDIYCFLHEYDPLAIKANIIAEGKPVIRQHLQLFLSKLCYVKSCLDGEDLQKLGIPAGTKLGEILEILHKAKLNGEVTTKDEEEKLARRLRPYG